MSGSRLRELQEQLQTHLLSGDGRIARCIVATPRVNVPTRLGIYANAYRLRLLEALRTDFPALHTLAGDETFDRIGRAYIDAHPSGHFSIRYFGAQFAAFLRGDEVWQRVPVFAEMAAFEWALGLAFDAADSLPVGVEDMAAIPPQDWGRVRFGLHSSLQRLDLCWNVPVLWKAIDEEQPPQVPVAGDYPRAWLIWRRELRTLFRSLSVDEAWSMDALRKGEQFAAMCEGLCEWHDENHAATQAALYLRRWVQDGLVVRVERD